MKSNCQFQLCTESQANTLPSPLDCPPLPISLRPVFLNEIFQMASYPCSQTLVTTISSVISVGIAKLGKCPVHIGA